MDRLNSVVCKAMVTLLQNWCRPVLYCGFLVRQCNCSGRHPGSAIDAHHVLCLVFVLLTELGRAAADALVYVRTISVALLHRQAFDSALPGLCCGEEFGEDMVGRLGTIQDRHTWAVTPGDVQNLFVEICPARINRRLLVSGLLSDIETEIRQRLDSHVTDDRLRIRYCPWQLGTSTLERHWEAEPNFPSNPYRGRAWTHTGLCLEMCSVHT